MEDMLELQTDVYSLQADKFLKVMDGLAPQDPNAAWVLGELQRWDREIQANSRGALLHELFQWALLKAILVDELGPAPDPILAGKKFDPLEVYESPGNLFQYYLRVHSFNYNVVDDSIDVPNAPFWDDVTTPEVESREEILERALSDVIPEATRLLVKDSEQWVWGALHSLYFRHPAGNGSILRRYVNRGPYAVGGDEDTVNQGGYYKGKSFEMFVGAMYRMVVDLSDWDRSVSVMPGGQSGQPLHPHYDDQIDLWLKGKARPMPFSEKAVDDAAVSKLVLTP
jgi:penicillin amidase